MSIDRHRTRILYVENGIGYGGAIICLRHLVRNLDRDKFEPMVITGLTGPQYREIATEARWKHIPDRHLDVVSMKRRLQAAQWPDALPGLRWLMSQFLARLDDVANFLPSFFQTLWTIRCFKPDLIHVNNEPLCNRAAVLAGKVLNVPVVAHVRGDQQGSMLMQSLFKMPDYFVAVSRWVSDSIGRLGVPIEKRTYIYDGIELQKLNVAADGRAFRRQHQIPEEAFVVGLVGLLIPWKGQMLFVESARQLLQEMPDAVFALVGGTPEECRTYEAELRKIAEQPELKGQIIFTGHVSDMAAVYNGLDVVLSASTSPEPLGTMIIEAMTMARPLIAPDHGGAVEMIENGKTGLLFKAGDAQDLAEKIRTLYRDSALRKDMGQSARAHALQVFSVEEHVRHIESVYKQLLKMP
ncbi:Putative glycosyltransferase EpsD [Anaerolineales bacterium]|nr:Putative glycosyltransferase EpsD [Anaerolineales bacterium]